MVKSVCLLRNLTGLSVFMVFLIGACSLAQGQVHAEDGRFQREKRYSDYIAAHSGALRPDTELIVEANSYISTDMDVLYMEYSGAVGHESEGFGGATEAVVTAEQGYIEWAVEVPQEGLYNIEVIYKPIPGRSISIERRVEINGRLPFDVADMFIFHRVWGDSGPFLVDSSGNEIRPRQTERPMWRRVALTDPLGYENEPLLFYLEAGENRIRFVSQAEPMAIAYLRLGQVAAPRPYADVYRHYAEAGLRPAEDVFLKVQGQDALYRSSPSLFAVFDQGDPTTEPYHPAKIRLNSIGGHRWQIPGDWIAWRFEVPESGLYQIAIKGKQDQRRGIFSNRRILINGEVPFTQLDAVEFPYSSRYRMVTLGADDDDGPFLVYLEKGEHELRLEVTLGSLSQLLRQTEETLYELNMIYRQIIMVTSANPDPLRSYQLERRIPALISRLAVQRGIIRQMAEHFESLTGQRGGHTAVLQDIARMLDRMVDRPDVIPRLLAEYRDGIGNLGTWVMQTRNQPLQIDYIIVASPEKRMPRATPAFWQTALHEIRAFIASFTHDFTGISDIGVDGYSSDDARTDPIKVWIGLGRDQAQVLKQMIEDTFTPETGIPVILELVNDMTMLLVPATIAGTAPDIALGAANMDLAFRGAVADLTQFEDFDEVAERFKQSALLTFRFRDRVFALPEAQSFPMLFYRKDVLAELGLEVPQTWDDVYAILPELQRRYLEFGLWPNISSFMMLLYQHGVALFQEDGIGVNLNSEAAVGAFEVMTDFYSLYGLPLQYDFVNRFRMGEMPLAISNYGDFNTLSVFAPEIRGQWGMAPVPGTRQPDGTIARTVPVHQDLLIGTMIPVGTTGSIIMENSEKKDEAWEFLKWWTRTDTQVRFGREMEALIGAAARYATANVEAMQQLPWRVDEREQLNIQWDWVEGVPPILGGYYVTRQFDWLFRAVVLHNQPIRESVIDYGREIDREIARKREELGYETDIELLDQKWIDLYWDHYTHVYRLDFDRDESRLQDVLSRLGIDQSLINRER